MTVGSGNSNTDEIFRFQRLYFLICEWLASTRASDGDSMTGQLVVELTLIKCRRRLAVHLWANIRPLSRNLDVFAMKGVLDFDDVDIINDNYDDLR